MSRQRKGKAPTVGQHYEAIVYKFACKTCGVEFERSSKNKHRNKYCSQECFHKTNVGPNHHRHKTKIVMVCTQCGLSYDLTPSLAARDHTWGNFCSVECKAKWQGNHINGENHPQWEGGKSYEPYCPLFNDTFRERVRWFFNNTCQLCGVFQRNPKLHVHHVDGNKQTCCDESPKVFVPLCLSCHSKVRHNKKYYTVFFHSLVKSEHNGRSYFTTEEWNSRDISPKPI
jgi:hypothetical protein